MKNNPRLESVVALIDDSGFLTVNEISRLCDVSEMTARRYLDTLDQQKKIKRVYGGAVSLINKPEEVEGPITPIEGQKEVLLVDQVDVLIGTSVNPYYDSLLIERSKRKNIPVIAESIEMPNQRTFVAVDNYRAGYDLGTWAGKYFLGKGNDPINLLDLTFHQPNTQERSRGFVDGLMKVSPTSKTILSINAQSRYATAYQLVIDALTVYPHINLISTGD